MTELKLAGRERWIDFRGIPRSWDVFYSTAREAGVTGAIRYIDAGSEGKQIHSAEREAATRQGIRLLLVDELNTGDAWDSVNDRAAGVVRARSALADAKLEGFGRIGISAAADAHAPSARHISDAVMYATGFASVVGKAWAGFYGFSEVLRAVRTANVVSWYWLAGSKPSAEDARWIAFWQDNTGTAVIGGVECDINWRLDGPIPGATKEEDMPLTGTDADTILNRPIPRAKGVGKTSLRAVAAYSDYYLEQARIRDTQMMAALAKLASDPNLTPAALVQIMEDAAEGAVAGLVEQQRSILEEIVREVIPDEQADEIVRKLGEKLRSQAETS